MWDFMALRVINGNKYLEFYNGEYSIFVADTTEYFRIDTSVDI